MENTAHFLTAEQRQELANRHRLEPTKRYADRIKIILALDKGLSYTEVAELFLLSDDVLRRHRKTVIEHGIEALLANNYHGYDGKLNADDEKQLAAWVNQNLFTSVQPVIDWCREKFNVEFTASGMRDLLHRLHFEYKHTVLVPGNADPEAQQKFVEKIQNLLAQKAPADPVIHLDAVHPTHNPRPTKVWGLRGEKIAVPSNTGRERINLNGGVNIETCATTMLECDTVNAQSAVELLQKIETQYPQAETIWVFADNARYYRSRAVREYLETSRIKLGFFPPYSPNLNLIERLWKFMHEQVTHNRYYEKFLRFRGALREFLFRLSEGDFVDNLKKRLTLNFAIVSPIQKRLPLAT